VMKFFVEKLIEYVASTLGRMLTQDDIIELDSTTETYDLPIWTAVSITF
jgi:hypothetical protein